MTRALILDFYVDEPACFGVPPYLSPYCRYAAGALVAAGVPAEQIGYLTVDDWRAQGRRLTEEPELVVIVAGATVPGKYLGGKIGTVAEVLQFLQFRKEEQPGGCTIIGGPIRHAEPELRNRIQEAGGTLIRGDVESYAYHAGRSVGHIAAAMEERTIKYTGERRSYDDVDRWAQAGAFLTTLHPNYPQLIVELETYRGCTRDVFCSFCTEAFYGKPSFRSLHGIHNEAAELHKHGNRFFRLGRQADLMTYLPDMNDFQNSFPRPVPASIESLYSGIRRAAPDLKLLHLDNINPGLIATFPDESREIMRIICEHNTPGDTAAMGLETADDAVIRINDLKCNAEEALRAIEITNEFGANRVDGVPALLPGINFIHGLPGESDSTFEKNYEFLRSIMDRGLLLRRINIRQVVTFHNTHLEDLRNDPHTEQGIPSKRRRPSVLEKKFLYYRDRIRREIDQPMLRKNFPAGTLIHNVILEASNQGFFLGRPLGSYPVTIKIPNTDPIARQVDQMRTAYQSDRSQPRPPTLTIVVTGAEERSLTGLTHPIRLNDLGRNALATIPGVSKKRASDLLLAKPLQSYAQLTQVAGHSLALSESDFVFDSEALVIGRA